MDGVVIALDVLGRRIATVQAERDEALALAEARLAAMDELRKERDELASVLARQHNGAANVDDDLVMGERTAN